MNTYTFHITPYDLAFVGIIFTGLTFALLLWFTEKTNRTANRFLGLAIVAIVLQIAWVLGVDIDLDKTFPHWSRLPLHFSLLLGLLIYFYTLKMTRPGYTFSRRDLAHFIPLLFELCVHVLTITESVQTGAAIHHTKIFQQLNPVLELLAFVSVIIYLYACRRLIESFYRRLKFIENDRHRVELRWLQNSLSVFGMCWLLWIPFAAANYLYYHQSNMHVYYPWWILMAVSAIRMGVIAFSKLQAFIPPETLTHSKPPLPAELRQKAIWLKNSMATGRYYLNPELNLHSLAETLQLHPNELSRIINTAIKKSFNEFINEYRVVEAAAKMRDPSNDSLTILGVGFDSGFNSKSSFHRIFKELTGKSPAEYKAALKNDLPTYNLRPGSAHTAIISRHNSIPKWSFKKLNRYHMFRNYLKIAWRNTLHNKVYSTLNIFGLAAGMALALLIGLWVFDQYSYDRFLPGYTQLYQVEMNMTTQHDGIRTEKSVALPLVDVLKKEVPGIKYAAESDFIGNMNHNLLVGDKKLYLKGGAAAPEFFKIFQYPFVKGNANTALKDIYSIVLTETTAKALFGDADPLGKYLRFDNEQNLRVTGVIKDIPKKATLQFSYLTPFAYTEATQSWIQDGRTHWTYNSFSAYVALEPGVTYAQIAPKIRDIVYKRSPDMRELKPEIILHPLKDWHLITEFKNGKPAGGFVEYVHLFSIIGILVLAIACINFVNLSTARSEKRAKEVGVRKAIGSARSDLVYQFLTESVLITFLSFLLCLLFVQLAVPSFNTLAGSFISIPYGNSWFWVIMIVFVLFTGLVAGSRPAFYLSSFNPVKVLKGTIQSGRRASLPRKVLVVLQFTCSVALIISTVIVYQQVQYVKSRPTGYSADRLVMTDMNGELSQHYDALRNELLSSGLVESMASSTSPPTMVYSHFSLQQWPGKLATDESVNIGAIWISKEYFQTLGMTMTAGRNFSGDWKNDSLNVIVNEATVRRIGLKNPVNQMVSWNGSNQPVHIIGVVKDALMESPYNPVAPAIFGHNPNGFVISYRLPKNADIHTSIAKIGKAFEKYNPGFPYLYKFVDDEYENKFNLEVLIGKLAGVFAGLAILISCLGLFGLAAYVAEQRTKEIGIRKVLGASISQVWMLLSRDFVLLVMISCVIASPLALYFLSQWLNQYQYHIHIGPGVFIASGIAAIIITLFTISFHAIKAALENPVKSLRSE